MCLFIRAYQIASRILDCLSIPSLVPRYEFSFPSISPEKRDTFPSHPIRLLTHCRPCSLSSVCPTTRTDLIPTRDLIRPDQMVLVWLDRSSHPILSGEVVSISSWFRSLLSETICSSLCPNYYWWKGLPSLFIVFHSYYVYASVCVCVCVCLENRTRQKQKRIGRHSRAEQTTASKVTTF